MTGVTRARCACLESSAFAWLGGWWTKEGVKPATDSAQGETRPRASSFAAGVTRRGMDMASRARTRRPRTPWKMAARRHAAHRVIGRLTIETPLLRRLNQGTNRRA